MAISVAVLGEYPMVAIQKAMEDSPCTTVNKIPRANFRPPNQLAKSSTVTREIPANQRMGTFLFFLHKKTPPH